MGKVNYVFITELRMFSMLGDPGIWYPLFHQEPEQRPPLRVLQYAGRRNCLVAHSY